MRRRQYLKLAGGGVILAAGLGCGVFYSEKEPSRAYQPWKSAGSAYTEPRLRALSYAILAPNPHNRQPWMIDLSTPREVTIYVDSERLLPATDPFNRQITIGLGCFLELMRMAAAAEGHRVELDLFPKGANAHHLTSAPIATATFVQDPQTEPDPLFDYALSRRSNKNPFDTLRTIPGNTINRLASSGRYGTMLKATNDGKQIADLRTLTRQALLLEIETPRTYRESVDLFRIGRQEIEANPDGISFSGLKYEILKSLGLFNREVALDTRSRAYKQGLDAMLEPLGTAMGYVWLVTENNTRQDQIAAGRDWLRINLEATRQGLGLHPNSQALQEYPEMQILNERAQAILAPEGGTVQMLGRLGYGPRAPKTPRWPLQHNLIKS